MTRPNATITFLALLLATACGSSVHVAGSSQGGGGAAAGGGGAGGTIPPECAVDSDRSPPYGTTFRITNVTEGQLFLREICRPVYAVSSCAAGYAGSLQLWADCTVDCHAPLECLECVACDEVGLPLDTGQALESGWSGSTYTFEDTGGACQCYEKHAAPPGRYRITVPVYASEQDAQLDQNAAAVSVDFELPAPSGVVEVPLTLAKP